MAAAPYKPKAKEARSATPTSDRSATLDAAVARKSQGLRGLPQHDYSIANIYDKAGFPWHADDKVDQQTQEAQEKYQDETIPEVRRRGLKRKVISIHDDSDQDDDEEIVVQTPQKSIKVEHFPGEPAPVETVEDRRPVVAGGDGNDAVAASRKRMKLEMEMQDIELARRKNALEMAAVDLDQRAHRVKYELDKLG